MRKVKLRLFLLAHSALFFSFVIIKKNEYCQTVDLHPFNRSAWEAEAGWSQSSKPA